VNKDLFANGVSVGKGGEKIVFQHKPFVKNQQTQTSPTDKKKKGANSK